MEKKQCEAALQLNDMEETKTLFGSRDENLKLIASRLKVSLHTRGENLIIGGTPEKVIRAQHLIEGLREMIKSEKTLSKADIIYALEVDTSPAGSANRGRIKIMSKNQYIVPRTKGQEAYVDAMRKHDLVFAIGPAGTGKTYLAMAMAVESLAQQKISRIILTRPAVEAGEKLGFLPGDLYEKVNPYLRPLYDALYDMVDRERIQKFLDRGIIEVVPLAYMRGRTLNEAFIILDEAQNATPEQMKMFLTRMGFDSRAVITGDITQSDLPGGEPKGILQAKDILGDIEGIKVVTLSGSDIVRHELVQKIIEAYERLDNSKNEKESL